MTSVQEYLRTSYKPDCDYVDGKVVARNAGELNHSRAIREVLFCLADCYPALRRRLLLSQRVQVKPASYRVPDVCVLAEGAPEDEITTTPPALCVEILSPEDPFVNTLGKIRDYFHMGVPTCWIIDPISRQGWIATPGHLDDVTDGILRADGIELPLDWVIK